MTWQRFYGFFEISSICGWEPNTLGEPNCVKCLNYLVPLFFILFTKVLMAVVVNLRQNFEDLKEGYLYPRGKLFCKVAELFGSFRLYFIFRNFRGADFMSFTQFQCF